MKLMEINMTSRTESNINQYNTNILKKGYKEMAKINLSFAESSMAVDNINLFIYEEILVNDNLFMKSYFDLEGDDLDD